MDEFRALLRERMRGRGDQARLAEASGIPSNALGRWRDGYGRPTDTNLRKLAPALGQPYESLAKMCGYLSDDAVIPDYDPIEQAIRQRTAEMRAAVHDTPRQFWPTIINATFDRAIDGARDMAQLLTDFLATSPEPPVSVLRKPRLSAPKRLPKRGNDASGGDLTRCQDAAAYVAALLPA